MAKKESKSCLCPCNRLILSVPVAIMYTIVLALVLTCLFMSADLMRSKTMTSPGRLFRFVNEQFMIVVTFALVSIACVTMGISTPCVRYRQIAIGSFVLLIAPLVAYGLVARRFSNLMNISQEGLFRTCSKSEQTTEFGKLMQGYAISMDRTNELVTKWMCSDQCPCDPELEKVVKKRFTDGNIDVEARGRTW